MKVLVVDDDRVLADLVAFTFQREGFEAIQAHDGSTALRRFEAEQPDLVVLDINLPELDGFTVCKRIREEADTPIVMLTVRGEEDDVVRGLDTGADDYISKPFSPRQLVARAHAVLRRAGTSVHTSVREVGNMVLDTKRRKVRIDDDTPVALSPLENRLLDYLMINVGRVVTTEAIIDNVWGPEGGNNDMVRQLIHRLRNKIEPDPAEPNYIETVAGVGYVLADSD